MEFFTHETMWQSGNVMKSNGFDNIYLTGQKEHASSSVCKILKYIPSINDLESIIMKMPNGDS